MILVVIVAAFVLPEPSALAVPKDPPPRVPEPAIDHRAGEGGKAILVARRRRRRRWSRGRRRRRRPRPAPKPKPAPAADTTPESDLAGHSVKRSSQPVDPGGLQRGGRVEFDGRLVQGQTAKSGAIYLFARKRSQLKSMVEERVHYRKEVLRTVYPDWKKEGK